MELVYISQIVLLSYGSFGSGCMFIPLCPLLLNCDHPPLVIGNLRFKLYYCGLLLSALFCDFREKLQPIKSPNCFFHVSAVFYFYQGFL